LTVIALLLLAFTLGVVTAPAQSVISAKSGMVAYHEGEVFLGDKQLEDSLTKFDDVKENGVLRTSEGRVEILLNPGMMLRLGENSSFKMITNRFVDTRLEILSGSATVTVDEVPKDTNVTILCKDGTVQIMKVGFYRFDTNPAQLRVYGGSALVTIGGQSVDVNGGKMLMLSGAATSSEKFDKEDTDALDRWSRRRADYLAMANVSAAKTLRDNGTTLSAGMWRYNPYFGLFTFIPASGRLCNPYFGYCYYSPMSVMQVFYVPPQPVYNAGGFGNAGYQGVPATSSGYSGTMASSGSVSSVASAPAAAASGSTASSSAGSASVGHGSASGGGHGH
jgi:hypothetical protein